VFSTVTYVLRRRTINHLGPAAPPAIVQLVVGAPERMRRASASIEVHVLGRRDVKVKSPLKDHGGESSATTRGCLCRSCRRDPA